MNENVVKLRHEGWFINEVKYCDYITINSTSLVGYSDIKKFLLNTDIKNYGESWLDVSNKNELECCGVLQIAKIRNVSVPEMDQDNQGTTGLYKYTVSDGVTSTYLLDLQTASQLSKGVEVGSKLFLRGLVPFKNGMLLLTGSVSATCMGGKVLELIRADAVQKSSVRGCNPVNTRGKGAPKFTPFGNKLDINFQEIKNFRAMKPSHNENVDESINTEFGEKREAALAEVRKAKGSDPTVVTDKNVLLDKFHGGATSKFIKSTTQKQDQVDSDISYLMSHGFNFTESKRALTSSNNDAKDALDTLVKNRVDYQSNTSSERGRGRGRRGSGRGRRQPEDPDGDDSWFDPAQFAEKVGLASRPNTTTSLAELMRGKSTGSETRNTKENSHFNSNLINRGFECLAQVMDGSYQPAVVLEVLPKKCLKIRYERSGEVIETAASSLKSFSGEKILEHMIPIVAEPLSHANSRMSSGSNYVDYRSDSGYGGRGRGGPNRRRGGRFTRGY